MIRIKAKLYQWFGIRLFYKEQLDYLESKEFWKAFMKIMLNPKNDMSPINVQGLLIGLWQVKHGFARPRGIIDRIRFRLRINKLKRLRNKK